ncbi:glycosyltransferase [Patescibacteria group bacterium]|nr:glycosyltransferase [Candidatus Micrarchaeota archaeon]MBU1758370.1 glycosyltransferase [Patescibacteria group bacterium]
MKNPLISIVIPTKNSEKTLEDCLKSIKNQSYQNYEIIIVDGFSNDGTRKIAEQYADKVFTSSVSVPSSRNFGFSKADGAFFLSIDSDMILEKTILEEIILMIADHGALIIPETGHGNNFISKCKNLEKNCYLGNRDIESARVFLRDVFFSLHGYDGTLLMGEDKDFHSRIERKFSIGQINSKVLHNTNHLSISSIFIKSYKYGKTLPNYLAKDRKTSKNFFASRKAFLIRLSKHLKNKPATVCGLFILKFIEYGAGFIGFIVAKLYGFLITFKH